MKSSFFAARGLFFTIFLWFFAAQLLIGAALYGLAAATERRVDRGMFDMAGGYIEARAKAAAIAYELGGPDAAREAWNVPSQNSPGSPANRGPEDRASASFYVLDDGAPRLLAGPSPRIAAARLMTNELEQTIEGEGGALWLARRVNTRHGRYLTLIRLRDRGGGGGGPHGFWEGFTGGRPGDAPWGSAARWGTIALVMAGLCFLLARHLTAPALEISRAARQFAAGDYATRVGPKLGARRDELAELGRDFDAMAARIETQRAAERRLLGDISHELRSPLARLQVALDLAESGADAPTRGYLARIEEEVEELGALIGQLLTLTRLENADAVIAAQPVDLAALLAEICADADFEASATNRTVELIENQPVTVCGDASLLKSAIENVVRNALNHAPDSEKIAVSSQTTATEAIVRVRDWGAGVPDDALDELFRPFYRVATARDRQSGGTGLGLSITQRALISHGGNARAFNAEGGGLEVELHLPLI